MISLDDKYLNGKYYDNPDLFDNPNNFKTLKNEEAFEKSKWGLDPAPTVNFPLRTATFACRGSEKTHYQCNKTIRLDKPFWRCECNDHESEVNLCWECV